MSRFVNLIRNSLTQPEQPGALAESCWSPKGIANSTSFSDFSLGTAGEVESVMTSPDISPTSSVESSHNYFARRMSCDYPAAAAGQHQVAAGLFRSSFDGRTSLWPRQPQDHGERNVWASTVPHHDTLAMNAPAPVKTTAAPVPKPPQNRQRKIDGLDFYEYVELIRSSSL